MSNTVRKPTAKKVFAKVKPVISKHVEVHFDRVFRVRPNSRLDGVKAKVGSGRFAIVIFEGDYYALPITVKTTSRQADKALGGVLKTRGIEIATLAK